MAADIEAIIAGEVAKATADDTGIDIGDVDNADTGGDGTTTGDATATVSDGTDGTTDADTATTDVPATDGQAAVKVVDDDPELTKLLEDNGIKASTARENRIPYSRVRKIIGNALKKNGETHQTALTQRDTELTTVKTRAAEADRWDNLIATDPDRTIQLLATLHPEKYGRFVGGNAGGGKADTKPAANEDPMPAPDVKYSDGSVGFSPEQYAKREAWNRREAVREAETNVRKDYEKRFGPMEQEWKHQRDMGQRATRIQQEVASLTSMWGDLFTKSQNEIMAEIQKADTERRPITLQEATQRVLIPKLQADKNKTRAAVLKELEKAPAAAKKTPATATKKVETGDPFDTETIIRNAIAASGLK